MGKAKCLLFNIVAEAQQITCMMYACLSPNALTQPLHGHLLYRGPLGPPALFLPSCHIISSLPSYLSVSYFFPSTHTYTHVGHLSPHPIYRPAYRPTDVAPATVYLYRYRYRLLYVGSRGAVPCSPSHSGPHQCICHTPNPQPPTPTPETNPKTNFLFSIACTRSL